MQYKVRVTTDILDTKESYDIWLTIHACGICLWKYWAIYGPIPIKTNNDAGLLPHIDLWLITTRSGKTQDCTWFLWTLEGDIYTCKLRKHFFLYNYFYHRIIEYLKFWYSCNHQEISHGLMLK